MRPYAYAHAALLLARLARPALAGHTPAQFKTSATLEQINIPADWVVVDVPQPESTILIQIGLKQKDMAGLQKRLMEISDYQHADYGKWLSKEQLEAYTSPADNTLQFVKSWLEVSGISSSAISQPTPDWLYVEVQVSTAEMLLNTEYRVYKNNYSNQTLIRTLQYSVPQILLDHIDTIQPTTSFHMKPLRNLAKSSNTLVATEDCSTLTTVQCVRTKYKVQCRLCRQGQ